MTPLLSKALKIIESAECVIIDSRVKRNGRSSMTETQFNTPARAGWVWRSEVVNLADKPVVLSVEIQESGRGLRVDCIANQLLRFSIDGTAENLARILKAKLPELLN